MAVRFAFPLAALIFMAGAAAAGAQPGAAAAKPQANADCLACHDDVGKPFASSTHAAASCVDCHADRSTVKEFPHPEKLAKVGCAGCHQDVAAKYQDSMHAWAKEKAGLEGGAGVRRLPRYPRHHAQRSTRQPHATRINVPATCGACHEGVTRKSNTGASMPRRSREGTSNAPMCADCHADACHHSVPRYRRVAFGCRRPSAALPR